MRLQRLLFVLLVIELTELILPACLWQMSNCALRADLRVTSGTLPPFRF